MSNVRTRYFVLDDRNRLHKASKAVVEGIWFGKRPVSDLKFPVADVLRVVTVTCNRDLVPWSCSFHRFEVRGDSIDPDSMLEVLRMAANLAHARTPAKLKRLLERPEFRRQRSGWPKDLRQQLAVALDVSPAQLDRRGFDGPLAPSGVSD